MKPTRGRDANSIPNGTLPLQHCAANNFSTSFLKSKKVRSTGFPGKKWDNSVAIANTLARRSNEICASCHRMPQVLFIRGVAERFGANEFFGASITRDTSFETCLLERITAQRPTRYATGQQTQRLDRSNQACLRFVQIGRYDCIVSQ